MEPRDQPYQQSLAQAQAGGGDGGVSVRSRSSSVVSTRTGVTITTLHEDTRSIRSMELVVGGRIFRINRDGSRITEQLGLPLYTAAPPEYSSLDTDLATGSSNELPAPNIPDYQTIAWPLNERDYHPLMRQHVPSVSLTQDRSEEHAGAGAGTGTDAPGPQDSDLLTAELPGTPVECERRGSASGSSSGIVSRAHSFVPGPEKITVVAKRRSVSESNIQANLRPNAHHTNANNTNHNIHRHNHNFLRRRNGIRLPQLDTGMSFETLRNAFSINPPHASSPRMTHSAGPSIGGSSDIFHPSPTYNNNNNNSNNNTTSTADHWQSHATVSRGRSPPTTPRATRSPMLAVPQGPPTVEEGYADTDEPPAMDTENEISIHFSRMIRSIDREHRRVLHQKCRELAELRERLNEVDQVYRKELRSRDLVIDELRHTINLLEFQTEEKVERARNEVEDIWEQRWKDQEKLLLDMQRRVSQADLSRLVGRRRGGKVTSTAHDDEEHH
ncbi:hypothetical protein TESG_07629 [Trichophyton tonsurans CBS 112818]|uniref:Uncharacterized protein n=1 Tax=Trichophyton tonsurans (strain CBS 112818) TaxID=647933 RepID=F2S9L6_TRIT1|nr:hypothetical protein TESG_07629 [Trichophyton tonsurans CBS 112818]